ncbi:MAG TPA: histidine kinase dimerization/phosphoacceptor domain-containing protein [Stellaceae bacterium]|nr:histidine kinase dimerization/phosphoacceptor domain-containing protein [Stellaceae bacterium]
MVMAALAERPQVGLSPAVAVERERIARDLNRYVIHRLFGIGLKLQALAVSKPEPAISGPMDECVRELDLAISDLRELVFRPGVRSV